MNKASLLFNSQADQEVFEQVCTKARALAMVQTPQVWKPFAMIIGLILLVGLLCLIFVPWQQSVVGYGEVTVFSPDQRPQTVNAQIKGRLRQWFVVEGQDVAKGDAILQLAEVDAKFLDTKQLNRLKRQRKALVAKINALQSLSDVSKRQITSYNQSREAAVPSASLKITQAENKVTIAEQKLSAAHQTFVTAELNLGRRKALYGEGLRSKRDLELAERTFAKTQAELNAAQAELQAAEAEQQIAQFGQTKTAADTLAKVQEAQAKLNESLDKLAGVQKELAQIEIDIANFQHRIQQRMVRAPMTGRVVRLQALGYGETVKEGQALAVVVPKTTDQAVALYVSDFNSALVSEGRRVRLQFSGWPAVQFVGWPSIAVGTFAGKVKVIDAVDDGKNRFRMLIVPDKEAISDGEQPWPSSKFLRPGAQATGWILLDTVPLGFEMWRQFNGFPPSVQMPELIKAGNKPVENKVKLKRNK
ncbi:MAG: HlyD family efflux transporter periplasmic adaptor subunit [Cyanobacteria bacterium HKST-UBA05]|nr:HlyD family efflux transporter periplasmic adaptor subunit [Cyanobacteria bacterium HKST-UBA05]